MFDLQVVALAKKPHEKAKATAVKAWNGKSEEIAGKAWENGERYGEMMRNEEEEADVC